MIKVDRKEPHNIFLSHLPQVHTPLICGEEAFGTSSNHAREKDGMWAALAWLQLLAHKNRDRLDDPAADLVSVADVVLAHWQQYGRHYYARYDWEEVDGEKARGFMAAVEARFGELKGIIILLFVFVLVC